MISLHQGSLQGDQICDGDNLDQQLFTPYGDQNMIISVLHLRFGATQLFTRNWSARSKRALVEFAGEKACSITAVIRWTV